jgi:iron complex transport system permease protein
VSAFAVPLRQPGGHAALYAALFVLLALAMWASLALGYRIYSPADIWAAATGTAPLATLSVIRDLRLPRAIIAPLVGAALGVAGVIVQTLARNRIAAPDTLGLNAGAAFAVVLASAGFGVSSLLGLSAAAAIGWNLPGVCSL